MPVSFTNEGELIKGGGTSIYRSTANNLLNEKCPKYTSLISLYNGNLFLSSYASGSSLSTKFQTFYSALDKSVPVKEMTSLKSSKVIDDFKAYQIEAISPEEGIFVSISYQDTNTISTAKVTAGKVSQDYEITLNTAEAILYTDSEASFTPHIMHIRDYKFVITFYDTKPTTNDTALFLKFGEVDPNTLKVTLSDSQTLFDYSSDYITYSITKVSDTVLLYSYYTIASPQLKVTTILINNDNTITVNESNEIVLSNSKLISNLDSNLITSDIAIVAFSDSNNNNIIQVQSIKVLNPTTGLLSFGSYLSVATVRSDMNLFDDIDVHPLSNEGDFVVIFSDYTNSGSIAVIGEIGINNQMSRVSPNINLADSLEYSPNVYNWASISSYYSGHLHSRTAIMSFRSDNDCSVETEGKFAIIDRLSGVVGMTTTYSKDSNKETITVSLTGSVSNIPQKLTPGKKYYTNSRGDLLPSTYFYGRTGQFVYNEDTDTVVLEENVIGVATDEKTIDVSLFKGRAVY